MTIRDEVALIIDPESIKGRESYAALPGFVSPEAAQKAADYQFGKAIKEAYAKADAILALSPPEPTEGQPESKAVQQVRQILANNGRNTANSNEGVRVGSHLHLCEMLLGELDAARAKLYALSLQQETRL